MSRFELTRDSHGCYRNAIGRIILYENDAIECFFLDSIFHDRMQMDFDDYQAMLQVESNSVEGWL